MEKVLTFALKNGGTLKYTFPELSGTLGYVIFESGKKYQYHVTLNLAGLTVTSKIGNWTATGAVEGDVEME